MTFPQVIRDVRAELFVDNAWTDITSEIYQRDGGLVIRRGLAPESTNTQPSTCDFTLNNRTGNFTIRNPLGAYYGTIGRNTPFRVTVGKVRDTFTRSVTDGWGSADTGEAWSLTGAGGTVQVSDWQVASGKGTQSVPVTSAYRLSFLAAAVFRDVDVAVTVTLPFTDVTGGSVEPANVALRGQATDKYYFARVVINTAEQVTVALHRIDGSETVIAAAVTVPGLIHSSSQALRVRAQIEGQTVRAKVWAATGAEPYDWHVTAHDEVITGTGWIGVRSGVAGGNTNTLPIVFSYDDLEVRSPRSATEISAWPQQWDVSGEDATAPVESAGILRRLGQAASPLQSAPRRFIPATTPLPIVYFPLEEGELSTAGTPTIGTGSATINLTASAFFNLSPRKFFAQGKLGVWLKPSVAVSEFAFLHSAFTAPLTITSQWTVDAIVAYDGGIYDSSIVDNFYMSSSVDNWIVDLESFDNRFVLRGPGGFSAVTVTETTLFDGTAHHVRLSLTQNGANCDLAFYIDGVLRGSGSLAYTLRHPSSVNFAQGATTKEKRTIGHIAVYGDSGAPSVVDAADAALGYAGETAGRRIERLCSENSVPFGYTGDLDDTPPMGPQGTDTLLDLIQECADADLGLLHESKGTLGLQYRTRTSLYNQTAVFNLNYSNKEVSHPLLPFEDDRALTNDVTASRKDGGEYQAQQLVPPLSVADPPTGVGRYDTSTRVNTETDDDLSNIAGWLLRLGTVDEARYPQIRVDLARSVIAGNPALTQAILDIGIGNPFTVSNTAAIHIYDGIFQLVLGYTEELSAYTHRFQLNCSPASPYQVSEYDGGTTSRYGSDGTSIAEVLDTTETAVDVEIGDGIPWTTDAAEMPIAIGIAGEAMSVTAIANTPITFVAAGDAAHADNADVVPGLPAGIQAGDVLLLLTGIRNTGAGVAVPPTGYNFLHFAGTNMRLLGKIATGSESAPTVAFAGGSAGDTCTAQIAAFRGVFHNIFHLGVLGSNTTEATLDNFTAQNIDYPRLDVTYQDGLILYLGWIADDSTAITSPGTEIGELSSTLGNDQTVVWAYTIQTTPTDIAAGSFTRTGGVAAISRGSTLALWSDHQTFTVTRSVNGVVTSHTTGATIKLQSRPTYAY